MFAKLSTRSFNSLPFASVQRCFFSTEKVRPIEITVKNLRESGNAMLEYYVSKQLPSGQIEGYDDCAHYCKLPHGLIMGGKIDEADRMLDFAVGRYLQINGDFMNEYNPSKNADPSKKTLHWEFADFYPYLNQWWITAGLRLNRFDFIGKAYDYVDKFWYNPSIKAGLVQDPLNDGSYNQHCIFNSAHLGLTYLWMNDMPKAIAMGDIVTKMVNKQPMMNEDRNNLMYFNRFKEDLELIESFPSDEDGVKNAAIINASQPLQTWWALGYPAAYSALLYLRTGNKKYLDTAEKIVEFSSRCNDDIRNNIVSHKVMWAASLVGNITGKKLYWDLCRDIASHIINVGQNPETGVVDNWQWDRNDLQYGEAQIIDQTGEIAYWFFVVARQMEKAELSGNLN